MSIKQEFKDFIMRGNVLLAVIVLLACLSTSVGLITACGEYFNRLMPQLSYHKWVVIFTLVSFGFANFGLSSIIKFSVPALMLLYPLTMAIIILAFLHPLFGGKQVVYVTTLLTTGVMALFDGWKTFESFMEMKSGFVSNLDNFFSANLPLYGSGLGWLLPAVVGFALGFVISKLMK